MQEKNTKIILRRPIFMSFPFHLPVIYTPFSFTSHSHYERFRSVTLPIHNFFPQPCRLPCLLVWLLAWHGFFLYLILLCFFLLIPFLFCGIITNAVEKMTFFSKKFAYMQKKVYLCTLKLYKYDYGHRKKYENYEENNPYDDGRNRSISRRMQRE